jgi:hypothetical protein
MIPSLLSRFVKRVLPASSKASQRTRKTCLHCEDLEGRFQPSAFTFSTGTPDGKMATISEPPDAHNKHVEFESADDFALTAETKIQNASFTGLLTGGARLKDVKNVVVEIYRVFPNDSDVGRTSGPPTFSTSNVPTRVNSPSDVALDSKDSLAHELSVSGHVLSKSFTANASVSSSDKIAVKSGGNGSVTGQEVEFDVTFATPFDLPAGHYFFVPQVGLSGKAPAGSDFLWLSAPKPIAAPGTPFPPGVTDLQSWMRDDPNLAPDWLRIGTDIIGGTPAPTFNATFSLSGQSVPVLTASIAQGTNFRDFTLSGQVTDLASEDHTLHIRWGDGTKQVVDLGTSTSAPFSVSHTFASGHLHHDTITVTAVNAEGVASTPVTFDVIV